MISGRICHCQGCSRPLQMVCNCATAAFDWTTPVFVQCHVRDVEHASMRGGTFSKSISM